MFVFVAGIWVATRVSAYPYLYCLVVGWVGWLKVDYAIGCALLAVR